ncbi:hypothetical protein TNCT_548191 [Trichonephila clavata]|uniref:Uncharacterized protein n=1 Tax=Trichonephila clavata TaxID=2740835 RepID=A0A8X6HUY3_TRICU|nr:hypothetical protein TNCT_548191 [Trichonephila clavata]
MDEGVEPMGNELDAFRALEISAWIFRVVDVLSSTYFKIPLYFSVLYLVIEIFIAYLIPDNGMWRLEASVAASFFFCHLCAKGSSIFPIDVNADRESSFTNIANSYFLVLFMIRLFSHRFLEDNH